MAGQRGTIRRSVLIACPADDAWSIVGDPGRLTEWWPGAVACTVDGDVRTVTTGSGLTIAERIVTRDPLQRRFQYAIEGGPLIREHLSTIDVHELDERTSLVVYSVDAIPSTMALVVGGAGGNALHRLAEILEGRS